MPIVFILNSLEAAKFELLLHGIINIEYYIETKLHIFSHTNFKYHIFCVGIFFSAGIMSFYGFRLEYALEGTSNFYACKDNKEFVLDENGLLEDTQTDIPKPPASNAQQLAQWKKDIEKSRRIVLEGVKYHVLLSLHGKNIAFAMWKTLIEIFDSSSDAKKLALKDNLRNIRMKKNETIVKYLSRFTQVKYELGGVGENMPPYNIVSLLVRGLSKSWCNY